MFELLNANNLNLFADDGASYQVTISSYLKS